MEFLVISQQMPQQQFQQPYPQQQTQQQYPQQPMQPASQQQAPSSGPVSMGAMLQWAGIAGAASGAVQAVLGLVSGFDPITFLMTVGIAAAVGIFAALILGQFGSKIPLNANLMVKSAAFMFVFNLIAGFVFGIGSGLALILGIAGIGAGAFAYGWIVQKKLPNLI